MDHDTYDRVADWMYAHQHSTRIATSFGGAFALVYGLVLGLMVSPAWLFLLVGVPLAVLSFRVWWHGFLRHLDRTYPSLPPEVACSPVRANRQQQWWDAL